VFSPGNPSQFQANYRAGQALLERLEALAASRAAVDRLRGSSAAAGWAKRWNLPVYFSLVFQDIAGGLLLLLLLHCHVCVTRNCWPPVHSASLSVTDMLHLQRLCMFHRLW
jgi:hypothetical protein